MLTHCPYPVAAIVVANLLDITAAEECLADGFTRALRACPHQGKLAFAVATTVAFAILWQVTVMDTVFALTLRLFLDAVDGPVPLVAALFDAVLRAAFFRRADVALFAVERERVVLKLRFAILYLRCNAPRAALQRRVNWCAFVRASVVAHRPRGAVAGAIDCVILGAMSVHFVAEGSETIPHVARVFDDRGVVFLAERSRFRNGPGDVTLSIFRLRHGLIRWLQARRAARPEV